MPAEPDVLSRIITSVRARVWRLKVQCPPSRLRDSPLYNREPQDFRRAFDGRGVRLIAEVKFASPSKGSLYSAAPSPDAALRIASDYLRQGAAAVSVLTEPEFFLGDIAFLRRVREVHPDAFLLMKDFVLDVYQLEQARAAGADCVLLICAVLGRRLETLLRSAEALGLSALVEVHTEAELQAARQAGASLIGVNTRDLRTLETDLAVAERLARAPKALYTAKGRVATHDEPVLIAESGVRSRADVERLSAFGYRGFLVGTALMQSGSPGAALRELLG